MEPFTFEDIDGILMGIQNRTILARYLIKENLTLLLLTVLATLLEDNCQDALLLVEGYCEVKDE